MVQAVSRNPSGEGLIVRPHRFSAFDVARHLRPHFRVDPYAVFGQDADVLAQPVRLDGDVALQRIGDLSRTARMSRCSGVPS